MHPLAGLAKKKARRFSKFELKVGEVGFPIHFECVSAAFYHRGVYAAAIFPLGLGEYGPFKQFYRSHFDLISRLLQICHSTLTYYARVSIVRLNEPV